jgi:hypothetical protein
MAVICTLSAASSLGGTAPGGAAPAAGAAPDAVDASAGRFPADKDRTVVVAFSSILCSLAPDARRRAFKAAALRQKKAAFEAMRLDHIPSAARGDALSVVGLPAWFPAPDTCLGVAAVASRGCSQAQGDARCGRGAAASAGYDPRLFMSARAAGDGTFGAARRLWSVADLDAVATKPVEGLLQAPGSTDAAPADFTRKHKKEVLRRLHRYGFAVLRDPLMKAGAVPPGGGAAARDAVLALRQRNVETLITAVFGTLRNTHFGLCPTWGSAADSGEAAAPVAHLDTAYLSSGITLHSDSTYFAEPPKVQAFGHIYRSAATRGGANVLCDAVAVARRMEAEQPEMHAALCRVAVPTYYVKEGLAFSGARAVFGRAAADAPVEMVSMNIYDRSPMNLSAGPHGVRDAGELQAWYAAYHAFQALCESPAFALPLALPVGDLLLFDNQRTLHARTAFTGPRVMCGAYVANDDYNSAMQSTL